MRSFADIAATAAARKGGVAALEALLSHPKSTDEIAATGDDRFLAEMTRTIFQAGFDWSLIDRKWPGFEQAFEGFDVGRWVFMSDDDADRLARDKSIVGNLAKIRSVGANAVFLSALARAHGSAAAFFAASRPEDYFDLVRRLKDEGSRLGGKTGQLFLRRMGIDAMILSDSVVSALRREGVIDKAPTSGKDMEAVRSAIDAWRAESGRSLTEISQILAYSGDE
jgi:3-methyladenine DNA glycosylase Tag